MQTSWRRAYLAAGILAFGGILGPAQAQQAETAVGVGIICNTSEQAQHFVSLRAGGAESRAAVETINAEAGDDLACGLAAVAFIRGETIETKTVGNRLIQVVRINIVAGFNGSGWQPVINLVQYAVIDGAGQTI